MFNQKQMNSFTVFLASVVGKKTTPHAPTSPWSSAWSTDVNNMPVMPVTNMHVYVVYNIMLCTCMGTMKGEKLNETKVALRIKKKPRLVDLFTTGISSSFNLLPI